MEKEEFQNKKNRNSPSSGKEKREDSLSSDKESAEKTNENIKNNLSEGTSKGKNASEGSQEEGTKEGKSRKESEVEAEKKKATSSQESAEEQEQKRKKEQDQPASEEEKKVEKSQENDTEEASQKEQEQDSSLSDLEKEKQELEKLREKLDKQKREIEKQRKGQKEELKEKKEKMKERVEKLTQGREELRKKREELEQKMQQGKQERENQKKKIKGKKQGIDIVSIIVTAFFVLAVGGLIFFFFAYNPQPNLSTPESPKAREANLSKPPVTHTECREGKCVEVQGEGESVCEVDSECTHTECRGDKCVLVNKKGEDLCQKDKDCKPALPPIVIDVSEEIILSELNPDVFISKIDEKFKTEYEPGTFIELVPKYNGELLTISQLFKGLALNPPEAAVGNLKNYTMYLYSQEELFTQERRNRLGIAFKIKEGEVQTVENSMEQWEKNLPDDFYKVHSLWQRGEKASDDFLNCKDPDYSNAGRVGIRYTNFPEPDLSIDWAIFEDILVITTSRESMYRTIDRLREQQD